LLDVSMSPTEAGPIPRPRDAWRVGAKRPFKVGMLGEFGWLFVANGALVVQGWWPPFQVVHSDPCVEIQLQRVMFPWVAVNAILHDSNGAVVVAASYGRKRALFDLLARHGFTAEVSRVWFGSSVSRARQWLT